MGQLTKHIQDARRRLMSPLRSSLDDGYLSEYVIDVLDELVTQLNQSSEPHFIQSSPITVSAGISVYSLDNIAPGFGKARYLYTEDPANPDFRRSPIEIVGLEALTEMYQGGSPSSALAVVPYSQSPPPIAASVYYSIAGPGPGNFIEFAPAPSGEAVYRFIWEPMVVRPASKDDVGLRLDQFDSLVAAKAALRALPHCEWKAVNDARRAERKADIRQQLLYDLGSVREGRGLEYLLWQWRQTNQNRVRPNAIGWAENRW